MDLMKLSENEKYMLKILKDSAYGRCDRGSFNELNDYDLKSALESLEFKDLAVDDQPTTEGIVILIALTKKGREYIKANPKLRNPNLILDQLKEHSIAVIVTIIGGILLAFLTMMFGLRQE